MGAERQRLDSWKAIAEYLGRDVRTALRWHRDDGMPVHRIGGSRGRAVFAYSDEIDGWLAGARVNPVPAEALPPATADPEARQIGEIALSEIRHTEKRLALAALLMVTVLAAAGFAWRGLAPGAGPIARASFVNDAVVAVDASGREVWRYALPHLNASETERHVRVHDVDGDRRPDVVASFVPWDAEASRQESQLLVIDSSGRLRWQKTLGDRVTFGGVEYGPPWYQDALTVYQVGGETRISGAFHHHTWWPDLVMTFDAGGRIVGRFVNSGWIYGLTLTSDGRHLLASGVNNALGGSVLSAINTSHPEGASPPGPDTPVCGNCPAGVPDAYLLWPRSELADPAQSPPTLAFVLPDGTIEVHANQRRTDGAPEFVAALSPALQVLHSSVSDSFRDLHRRLEDDHKVTHPLASCPWLTPPVKIWTPSGGWRGF
jgi:hypothetical protein